MLVCIRAFNSEVFLWPNNKKQIEVPFNIFTILFAATNHQK